MQAPLNGGSTERQPGGKALLLDWDSDCNRTWPMETTQLDPPYAGRCPGLAPRQVSPCSLGITAVAAPGAPSKPLQPGKAACPHGAAY